MKKSKLQNTTVIDITGKRIIPNLYTSHSGDYLPGDILDANSVIDAIKQNVGNITDGAPEELDSLQEVSEVITQLNQTIDDLQQETGKLKEQLNSTPKHAATTDKTLANPGDLVIGLWDENDECVVTFVDPLEAEKYKVVESGTMEGIGPIGIVVVPASHTTDGTVRIASIKYMDYNNSADGADSAVSMYWGYSQAVVDASTLSNKIVTYVQGTTTVSLESYSNFATTDTKITFFENTDDPGTYYNWNSQFGGRIPSPYNTDGTQNTLWDTAGQILVHRDGKTLTQSIKNKTTWNTGDAIINKHDNANMYPAAFSCLNYNVAPNYFDGAFSQGNWYLPSVAELGYLIARFKEINATRQAAGSDSLYNHWFWSSSEAASEAALSGSAKSNAWGVSTKLTDVFGRTGNRTKVGADSVLAFVAF